MKILVNFTFHTGLRGHVFPDAIGAQLWGSWDGAGHYSDNWSSCPMTVTRLGGDGCLRYEAQVQLDDSQLQKTFSWGVALQMLHGGEVWAICTEVKDRSSREHKRVFVFKNANQHERYYFTHCRRLGANKYYGSNLDPADVTHRPGICFSVWAPNAKHVQVVMGKIWDTHDPHAAPTGSLPIIDIAGGYIADDGTGINSALGPFEMHPVGEGVWETDPNDLALRDFTGFDHRLYMFRITKNDGSVAFRTDLYSRCQVGFGSFDPKGTEYRGLISGLDGTKSCSVVVDPERVTKYFRERRPYLPEPAPLTPVWPEMEFVPSSDFWNEVPPAKLPARVEDLIIYELHVGALGFGDPQPGTLEHAIQLLDHVQASGANTVELLPMSEFGGGAQNWGYATSHYFAIEFGGGGRDQYKYFVRECHRRGLAVILDVVYNHYAHDAERAELHYDSDWPDHDCYYWYEGTPYQYSDPKDGYVDNMSTAFAPCYHEEMVRRLFISSAAALMLEFHIDGFRVDQTTSIHGYNRLHADGREVPDANRYGAKMLRELGRTLRLLKPGVFLIAEDHSGWQEVTESVEHQGMGFDLRWYSEFYHHLAGDTGRGMECANLLLTAATHPGSPLAMDYFAGALRATADKRLVYAESHDEAGNSGGNRYPFYDPEWRDKDKKQTSHRTMVVAVNGAPLVDDTRKYAEARSRFAWGVTALSAGTPMFLFGEEVGAVKRFKYNGVLENKENYLGLAAGDGKRLLHFYSAINGLRKSSEAVRSRNIEILHIHNQNRVLVFRRWEGIDHFLIFASLNDEPFDQGYFIQSDRLWDGQWREVFNSDATEFGGENIGNLGSTLRIANGEITVIIPRCGLTVFQRVGD